MPPEGRGTGTHLGNANGFGCMREAVTRTWLRPREREVLALRDAEEMSEVTPPDDDGEVERAAVEDEEAVDADDDVAVAGEVML